MAPLRVVTQTSLSWTAKTICRLLIRSLLFVCNDKLFLMVIIFQSCPTLGLFVLALQTRRPTGSVPSSQNTSLQSKTSKESTGISPSSSTGTSGDQETGKPSPFVSEKSTTLESSPANDYSSMKEDSSCFEIGEEFSTLGIHDIMSFLRLANYKSMNLNMPADERKEINGSFPGSGGEAGILPWKATIVTNCSMNLHASLSGQVVKKPMEHDEPETLHMKHLLGSPSSMNTPAKGPSDGETTESKSGASNENGSQKVSSAEGRQVPGACQNKERGRPKNGSNSGSGGDDGGDDRRPSAPVGGCQADSQADVGKKKERRPDEEQEKQGNTGDDDDGNYDGNDDDDGHDDQYLDGNNNDDDDGNGDDDDDDDAGEKENNLPELNGYSLSKEQTTNENSVFCESSSAVCVVSEYLAAPSDRAGHQSPGVLNNAVAVSAKRKPVDQGLRLDVERARRFSQAAGQAFQDSQISCRNPDNAALYHDAEQRLRLAFSCRHNMRAREQCSDSSCRAVQQAFSHTQNCPKHVLGGCRQCTEYKNTLLFHVLSCRLPFGKCVVEKCDDIRKYLSVEKNTLPPDRKWTYHHDQLFFTPSLPKTPTLLGSPISRKIQRSLSHTQNCRKRVQGGCEVCSDYLESMVDHASRCDRPVGMCGIRKCDDIKKFSKTSSFPDRDKWTRALDEFFFGPSPIATPTLLGHPEEHSQIPKKDFLNSDGSMVTFTESSSRAMLGLWNQYHVDRPPDSISDLSVRRDEPADITVVAFQQSDQPSASDSHEDQTCSVPVSQDKLSDVAEPVGSDQTVTFGPTVEQSAAPLSAVHVPDASRGTRDTTPRQEVLWPINSGLLSVCEDGSYIENVHWMRGTLIGGGSSGHCYMCTDLKTGFMFAIKRIPEERFEMTELEIWGDLSGRHPNILELYGAVKSKGKVTIFMEYMEGGSVEDVGKMHEVLACHIFCKVLNAVDFMHSQGIVHRDVKGANILIDETGQKVKLADFGTSIRLCNGYQQDNVPRGTEPFMAPEVCRSQPHSFSADIWSSMCVLYQMLTGTPPWEEYHHCHRLSLLYQIGVASLPPPSPQCSPEVEDLFRQGFQLEPTKRATAKELLKHKAFVADPDVSNMTLPRHSTAGSDPDYESSLSSLISGTDSVVMSDEEEDDDEKDDEDDGSGIEADDNDSSTDDDDDDDDGDDVVGGESCGEAELWREQREPYQEALSAEQQLQSLQTDLFYSLSGEELETLVLNEIAESSDVTDNDINLLSSQEDFDFHSILDQINLDANVPPSLDGSYSIADLTKLHIKDSDGNLLFSVRERPTTTYGSLGRDLHGNIASVLGIDAFSLTRDDGTPLNVHAEVGGEEQAVIVVRAHDTDDWQLYHWRVDVYGLVEQSTRTT